MKLTSQWIILFGKIAIVIILVGYLVGVFFKPNEFWYSLTRDYSHSKHPIDGLDNYVEKYYTDIAFSNLTLQEITHRISPDWRWIVYHNKNSNVEFASIENPNVQLADIQSDSHVNLISWSPNGQVFVGGTLTGIREGFESLENHTSNKLILYHPLEDGTLIRYEFLPASVNKSDFLISHELLAWSPDGKYLALMANFDSGIIIVDAQGTHLQTIQEKMVSIESPVSELYWTSKGLVYIVFNFNSSNDFKYKLILIDPDAPNQQIEVMEFDRNRDPNILGKNDNHLLISEEVATLPRECKLTLVNLETREVVEVNNVYKKCFRSFDNDLPNAPYTLLVTDTMEIDDQYWVFDWKTKELKELFLGDILAAKGWNPVFDGSGVLRRIGGSIELWVVKP